MKSQKEFDAKDLYPIAVSIMKSKQRRGEIPLEVNTDDLVSIGIVEGMKALHRFDGRHHKNKAVTYVYPRVRGAIEDAVRSWYRYASKYESADPSTLNEQAVKFDNEFEREEIFVQVMQHLLRMPTRTKQAVLLRFFSDSTDVCIAGLLHMRPADIEPLISQALDTIRDRVFAMNGGRGSHPWC